MNILFTVFGGSSAELLLREAGWQGLLLPSDKKKDAQLLISEISSGKYDYIFSFGQKPGIKDKVYIETTARNQGDALETGFDCGRLADALRGCFMQAKLSDHAGTSFCNHLYWSGLEYIRYNRMDVKMVFVHIPMRKNILEFGEFSRGVRSAVERVLVGDKSGHVRGGW